MALALLLLVLKFLDLGLDGFAATSSGLGGAVVSLLATNSGNHLGATAELGILAVLQAVNGKAHAAQNGEHDQGEQEQKDRAIRHQDAPPALQPNRRKDRSSGPCPRTPGACRWGDGDR